MRGPVAGAVLASIALVLAGTASPAAATASGWDVPIGSAVTAARSQAAPAAPGGLSATCTVAVLGAVTISWSSVAGAAGYTVYRSSQSASGPFVSIGDSSGTLLTANPPAGATSWFVVRARVGDNWVGAASAPVSRNITAQLLCQ